MVCWKVVLFFSNGKTKLKNTVLHRINKNPNETTAFIHIVINNVIYIYIAADYRGLSALFVGLVPRITICIFFVRTYSMYVMYSNNVGIH